MGARGKLVVKLVLLGVCLAGLVWVVRSLGPERVAHAVRSADPGALALSVAAIGARYLVWGVKWRIMLERRGAIGFLPTLSALLAGVFVNLTTPTAKLGGGFVRAALVHRRTGWGMATAYGWSLADQVTNSLGNVLLAGIVLPAAALRLPAGRLREAFFALGALSLLGVVSVVSLRARAWAWVRSPRASAWLVRITPARFRTDAPGGPGVGWVEPVFSPTLEVGATWRVVPLDLGLAALSCSFLCASNFFALRAVGIVAPFVSAAAVTVLAGLFGTLVGTLGGIGATELALIGLFGRMRVPAEAAAAATLLHRAAYYLVSLVLGGIALGWESRSRG